MQWFTEWRRVAVVTGLALALVGCTKPAASNKGTTSGTTAENGSSGKGPDSASSNDAGTTLLQELSAGKFTADRLTPGFRTEIAPPLNEDDKKAGYSAATVEKFLAKYQGIKFSVLESGNVGPYTIYRGRAENGAAKEAFSARFIQVDGKPCLDWLHRSDRIMLNVPKPDGDELRLAIETARNFLDLLIGVDPAPAQSLMSMAWRKGLAPSAPGVKAEYDAGFLTQQMKSWRLGAVGSSITKADLAPNKLSAEVMAELEADGKKVPYKLRLAFENNRWAVTAFEKQ